MLFAVLFEDDNNCAADVRARYMPAHLDFLSTHASMIRAAGPLRRHEGSGAGGLWLVDADSADEVDRLVKTDPFWPTGLRRSVRILIWKQVFADGARL
ncbi:YciI family protein [Paraburkholderia sp. BR14374]|uniref:YciI family protein n=1 Tax=Paraburkholderia sp. BR14374 TaxID=3237007 RepID=UPI0034CE3875